MKPRKAIEADGLFQRARFSPGAGHALLRKQAGDFTKAISEKTIFSIDESGDFMLCFSMAFGL